MRLHRKNLKRRLKQLHRYYFQPHLRAVDVSNHLSELGVTPGGTVLIHSSLSAHGYFPEGPDGVIQSFINYLGDKGTVIFPTHTWRSVNQGKREFNLLSDPSQVGLLSERFRHWPRAARSMHPSHSVSALGPQAGYLIEGHESASSPCGMDSPYERLLTMGGEILLFGVGLRRNTCFHAVEALANVPYLLKPEPDRFQLTDETGHSYSADIQCHAKAIPSRFDETEQELIEAGCLKEAKLGLSRSIVLKGRAFLDYLLPILRKDPHYLLQSPPNPSRQNVTWPAISTWRRP